MVMLVEFYKRGEGRLCAWVATPPKRRPFEGSTMAAGRDLPHDLTQFVIERALDVRDGFWGLLAHGAWFASVPGRRSTRPGRAVVRAHREALISVESVVNGHYLAWRRGEATSAGPALDDMYTRWRELEDGGRLVLEWPVRALPVAPEPSRSNREKSSPRMRPARRGAA